MSIEIMSAVWRHSRQKGSALLLLLSLADYANEAGISYPSVGTLARKVRMSERNVQTLLKKLEADGELVIDPNSGPNGVNRYRLIMPQGGEKFSPPQTPKNAPGGERGFTGGVNVASPGGERGFTGGVNVASPDPSVDPPIDPSVDPSDDDDDGAAPKISPPIKAQSARKNAKRPSDPVVASGPTPPIAPPPPPAEVEAVVQVLCDRGISASPRQAQVDAQQLLAAHPPDWIIRAAIQTSDRHDVQNRYAYMVKVLGNWELEGGPRPKWGDLPEDSVEERRRKYIPDEYSDIIIG